MLISPPDDTNDFCCEHTQIVRSSYTRWTGRNLVDPNFPPPQAAKVLFHAPFALLSHDAAADPVLNYGNRLVLELFDMSWEELIVTPSRLTAEAPNRAERARMLATVSEKGIIDDYAGVRISRRGRRFKIEKAAVWNLIDSSGNHYGQAAMFSSWEFL